MTRKYFFWPNMKKEVAEYLARCIESQQVMVEHQHPTKLFHPLPILEWKWEVINMDFIIVFPKNVKKHESIMVVLDKLSKETHFIR